MKKTLSYWVIQLFIGGALGGVLGSHGITPVTWQWWVVFLLMFFWGILQKIYE